LLHTQNFFIDNERIGNIISSAIDEDLNQGDITTELLIPENLHGDALITAKDSGTIAGGKIAEMVFKEVSPSLEFRLFIEDGNRTSPGDTIATVSGSINCILKAERIALNFLQRLSGIATATSRYVDEISNPRIKIMDTRKTTPGLRLLEKYAVYIGGGVNHRFHLGERILIKDNHLTALRRLGLSLKDTVRKAKNQAGKGETVEVEVGTREEASEAVQGGADIILLDNMAPDDIKSVLSLIPKHVIIEVSGGITIDNIRSIAMPGVDRISIGVLTHSVKALDISLELVPESIRDADL